MTIVWVLLWLLLAIGVIGFIGWSTNILMAQKKAWQEFAAKHKLEITQEPGLLKPVSLAGLIGGRRTNIYSQTEQNPMEKMQRIYTHVEVFLNTPPAVMLVLSKKLLPSLMSELTLPIGIAVRGTDWPVMSVAQTNDPDAAKVWLNVPRQRALNNFMSLSNKETETIFICNGVQAFLIWRSEDPLRDPKKLNALVQKLFALAKELDAADAGISAKP